MKTQNDFNFVAPFYDLLVRLVFGKKLWEAQKTHLHLVEKGSSVLVLGGGTGRILEWLPDCKITYIDASKKMIEKAKKRGAANFICSDFLAYESTETFDWIICPFFLDCFEDKEFDLVVRKIEGLLNPNSKMIVTDFKADAAGQRLIVRSMILFFRVFARLGSKKLLEIQHRLEASGFLKRKSEAFSGGLIFSSLFVKCHRLGS